MSVQWTDKVEEYVAQFIGSPLTYDTVMLRPWRRDGTIDKEVCDVLFTLRGQGIVVALKSQHEESQRDIVRLHEWCAKNAREAVRALNGATRTIASRSFACRHPRRGLVTFDRGSVVVRHALAVLEVEDECVILPNDLPDRTKAGVPLTYLSTNDFLNIVREQRAFPDIIAYLDARLALPHAARTVIGHERLLYRHYLLNDESFTGCGSAEVAQAFFDARREEWSQRLRWKQALDLYARIVEHVSDSLATRPPNWRDGLDAEMIAMVRSDEQREQLQLQEELLDLPLGARRRLGRAFALTHEKVAASTRSPETAFCPVADIKQDFVYVVLSTRGVARNEAMRRTMNALVAALAHFAVPRGMAIADRDSESFEFAYGDADGMTPELRDAARKAGVELFTRVRFKSFDVSTLPRDAESQAAEAIRLARQNGWTGELGS